MSRSELAIYVQDFFERLLFSADEAVSTAALEKELSPEAEIMINGNTLHRALFAQASIAPFRAAFTGKISESKDLNILSEDGKTGLVSQFTTFETSLRADGSAVRQVATTLVEVSKKEGTDERWITGIWEIIGPA